ncbi:MAG: RloB domain-containing protein [bacterium]|nr:RloB domain-containing protein [bacterium]
MSKLNRKNKKNKIRLIILEGESEKHFYNSFKEKYAREKVDVFLLGENKNFRKIDDNIKISINVLGYKQVWLVLDLKTQKSGTERHYRDKKELLTEYRKNLKQFNSSVLIVVIQDLECWLLLYFNKYPNTETIDDAEKRIKKLMEYEHKAIGKPQMARMLLKKPDFWDKLITYKNKNKSFRKFLELVNPDL